MPSASKAISKSHTPGPWKHRGPYGSGHSLHYLVHDEAADRDGGYFCQVDALNMTAEAYAIAEANASLIAAAPDLLAACVECESINRNDHSMTARTRMGEKLRAVILRAKGGA